MSSKMLKRYEELRLHPYCERSAKNVFAKSQEPNRKRMRGAIVSAVKTRAGGEADPGGGVVVKQCGFEGFHRNIPALAVDLAKRRVCPKPVGLPESDFVLHWSGLRDSCFNSVVKDVENDVVIRLHQT
ncbi:hypothetical protein F2P81_016668 [Scophthalmus maximus]|uniref:Uncharacterized protein n=1 Tax=Scophthalmus maximus TaxID=52904 RepID=A0A6A4SD78_SCOMX|nr:hypothetical protein F2P81_016668 [Scophthalmus maximus]